MVDIIECVVLVSERELVAYAVYEVEEIGMLDLFWFLFMFVFVVIIVSKILGGLFVLGFFVGGVFVGLFGFGII